MQRTKSEYRLNDTTVHPLAASEIDVGAIIMIEGYPCKLTDVRRDEYAANGNATDMKIKVCGKDIFDGRAHSQLLRLHDEVEAVSVIFEECRVQRIKDELIEMVDEFEDPRAVRRA